MAALTPQAISVDGVSNPTYAAAGGGGDTLSGNDVATGRVFISYKNASGSAITVTMVDPTLTPAGKATTDPTYSVPAISGSIPGQYDWFVPPAMIDSTGNVSFTYSASANLSVLARRV